MFHTIIIAGNLGRDPEMRYTPSGSAVTTLNIASSRQFTNSQGQQAKETIWFRATCWNKLAEYANTYLKKGHKVLIEGRLNPDSLTGDPKIFTRNDGTAAAKYEVNVITIRSLTSRSETENTPASVSSGYQEYSDNIIDEDEIPF